MQNTTSWLLYFLFAIILIGMYMGIRRRWLSPALIGAFGVLSSILLMTLVGLAQGNPSVQAAFVGILVGGLFSVGTLVMAVYFTRSESRRRGQP